MVAPCTHGTCLRALSAAHDRASAPWAPNHWVATRAGAAGGASTRHCWKWSFAARPEEPQDPRSDANSSDHQLQIAGPNLPKCALLRGSL